MSTRLKALVVEDSPHIAERVYEMLRDAGVEVVAICATEDDAIKVIDRQAVDLATIDLQLAQGTGFGVIRAIRSAKHVTAIAVLTNHAVPALKVAAFEAGADWFLDKARDFHKVRDLALELALQKGLEGVDESVSRA